MCSAKFGTPENPLSRFDMLIGATTGESFSQYVGRSLGVSSLKDLKKKPEQKKVNNSPFNRERTNTYRL